MIIKSDAELVCTERASDSELQFAIERLSIGQPQMHMYSLRHGLDNNVSKGGMTQSSRTILMYSNLMVGCLDESIESSNAGKWVCVFAPIIAAW
ncbi:hypothetical protein Plhal703r1_c13g0067791 [Plasmopara halstedii]